MELPERGTVSRRKYLRTAVAVGGTVGLSACLDTNEPESVPQGDPTERPERQHAWNDALETDTDGNYIPPKYHVILALETVVEPDDNARERVETALQSLERSYAYSADGLLFALGYSPSYFETPPIPQPTELTSMESPEFDTFDAVCHLASDHPEVVIEAEEALFGEVGEPNGNEISATFTGVFERATPRRTGFVGAGLPAQHRDLNGVPDSIPENAPFFMGFRSGFAESQAPEDRITIESGPFEGGTTMHVSTLDLQLQTWFEQDNHFQRVAKTYSPEHARDGVGSVGEELGRSTGVAGEIAARTEEDAKKGLIGHAQKAARARDADGTPPLLRRDFNTVDGDQPGIHFVSYQRTIDDFVRVREAMTGADLTGKGVGQRLNNGILQYIFVRRRGNFIIPPRSNRSLPDVHPN